MFKTRSWSGERKEIGRRLTSVTLFCLSVLYTSVCSKVSEKKRCQVLTGTEKIEAGNIFRCTVHVSK